MITPREQMMIEKHDAGKTPAQIAGEMGISVSYVQERLWRLCSNLGPDVRHAKAMENGSRALLRAIRFARAA